MRSAYGEYFQRRGMMAQQSGSAMTGKPLIENDRVEGTTVYDPSGNNIGSIKRLMIEKISGGVAYAVMSFGGFLGWARRNMRCRTSSPTTQTWVGTGPISPSSSCAARQLSRAIVSTIGTIVREPELHDY
jgi:hypothetical protein